MTDDHLDKETSVSAELTESGVTASTKSRAVAAIDRLVGSFFDRWSAPLESKAAEERAKSKAKVDVIDAVKALGIQRMKESPEFASLAIEQHLDTVFRRQENKVEVVREALQDLERKPTNDEMDASDTKRLDEGFLSRFERYAEDASNDELRAKWGKVLAAEIRNPGTVSAKTMRVVDELDAATAQLFERLCSHVIGNTVIKCLAGELHFEESSKLVSAGLMVEPGMGGQVRKFFQAQSSDGYKVFMVSMLDGGVIFAEDTKIPVENAGEIMPVRKRDGNIGMPVYVLTDVGAAVAAIVKDRQSSAFVAYAQKLAGYLAPASVEIVRANNLGGFDVVGRAEPVLSDKGI